MASLYTNYCEALETKSRIIQDDINKITQVLEIEDEKELLKVHTYIDGKYQAAILDWGKSCYSFDASYGFDYNYLNKSSLLHNLLLMKSKLEAFKNGWNISELNNKNPNINVNTTTNVNINITFEHVRNNLRGMTSLNMKETQEAITKVDELENIVNSGASKKAKWEKAKPILTWMLDKSFDVAINLLPLFLNLK